MYLFDFLHFLSSQFFSFFYNLINFDLTSWSNRRKFYNFDISNLRETSKFLKNSKNLVIAVQNYENSESNIKKLADLISWAWLANIQTVTLYEPTGQLKSQKPANSKLCHHLKEALHNGCDSKKNIAHDRVTKKLINKINYPRKIALFCTPESNGNKSVGDPFDNWSIIDKSGINGEENGWEKSLSLFIYSLEDSYTAMVSAIGSKFLDKNDIIKNGNNNFEGNVDMNFLSTEFDKAIGWPSEDEENEEISQKGGKMDWFPKDAVSEPDLMMVLGSEESTIGFLPWHIRLTEIHWLPPLKEVELGDFYNSLKKFAGCEQRVGK